MPLLWALGWTVTTVGGIDVDQQFAVFGAYGAITFMALSGVLLDRLRERNVRSVRVACTHGLFTADAVARLSRTGR